MTPGISDTVKLFDRVSVDGRAGTAVGFFFVGRQRRVLVRFDRAEVVDVPEARLRTLFKF